MRDPVVAADGHTYERAAVEGGWRLLKWMACIVPHLASCFYLTFPLLPRFPLIVVQAASRGRRQRVDQRRENEEEEGSAGRWCLRWCGA